MELSLTSMAIKLPDYLFLLPLLSLHFYCSSALSFSLEQSPSSFNKNELHPFSHFTLFLRNGFWFLENSTPEENEEEEGPEKTSITTSFSSLRKLLDHIKNPNSSGIKPTVITLPSPNGPSATPITTPSTNQVPAFPYNAPPVMVPVPVPPPPVLGQTWCVARPDASETALQNGLDYACGLFGGVDCTAIQYMRSCYNPNTLRAHASYAFNSYYQRNPVPSSCDFSATAMLVNVNPSSSNCTFPSSSSVSSFNPTVSSGAGSISGLPEVNNADNSGSTTVIGSDNPVTSSSNSTAIYSANVAPLIFAFTLAYVRGRI